MPVCSNGNCIATTPTLCDTDYQGSYNPGVYCLYGVSCSSDPSSCPAVDGYGPISCMYFNTNYGQKPLPLVDPICGYTQTTPTPVDTPTSGGVVGGGGSPTYQCKVGSDGKYSIMMKYPGSIPVTEKICGDCQSCNTQQCDSSKELDDITTKPSTGTSSSWSTTEPQCTDQVGMQCGKPETSTIPGSCSGKLCLPDITQQYQYICQETSSDSNLLGITTHSGLISSPSSGSSLLGSSDSNSGSQVKCVKQVVSNQDCQNPQ